MFEERRQIIFSCMCVGGSVVLIDWYIWPQNFYGLLKQNKNKFRCVLNQTGVYLSSQKQSHSVTHYKSVEQLLCWESHPLNRDTILTNLVIHLAITYESETLTASHRSYLMLLRVVSISKRALCYLNDASIRSTGWIIVAVLSSKQGS